ncbi:hypothetical protein B0A50_03158 [Salinomyces thailandicus]|uniref:Uncharacterized protein n=1 Tax=Salinomyces thailandicus TaxID=706561 RepID=A0A4U0U4K9_9PEZI|nr:hypothetical protein B0A50_03158 [Salinomyces thailandica]
MSTRSFFAPLKEDKYRPKKSSPLARFVSCAGETSTSDREEDWVDEGSGSCSPLSSSLAEEEIAGMEGKGGEAIPLQATSASKPAASDNDRSSVNASVSPKRMQRNPESGIEARRYQQTAVFSAGRVDIKSDDAQPSPLPTTARRSPHTRKSQRRARSEEPQATSRSEQTADPSQGQANERVLGSIFALLIGVGAREDENKKRKRSTRDNDEGREEGAMEEPAVCEREAGRMADKA